MSVAAAVTIAGCATTGGHVEHCATSELREAAEAWLPLVELAETSGAAVATTPTRSYVYDQALALLWASWTGRDDLADRLARTLSAVQQDDGSWGFWFELSRPLAGGEGADLVRNGAGAWAVHALAYHAARSGTASPAAERGARFLADQRIDGLVRAGRGLPRPDGSGLDPDRVLDVAVTEHQLDAWMAFISTGHVEVAAELRARILDTLWLETAGYLAVARGANGVEAERALDAAGGWGALWLQAAGESDRARRSLRYVLEHFTVPESVGVWGQRPYLDRVDDWPGPQKEPVIFTEGSLGVGLAALRLGQPEVADLALAMAGRLACPGTRSPRPVGVPGANRDIGPFSKAPSVASTVWFLLLERERRLGQPAPVFLPQAESGRADEGEMT